MMDETFTELEREIIRHRQLLGVEAGKSLVSDEAAEPDRLMSSHGLHDRSWVPVEQSDHTKRCFGYLCCGSSES